MDKAMALFDAEPTGLDGLLVIQRTMSGDARGQFGRLFCADDLKPFGWTKAVTQSNLSVTIGQGTVRGIHFQHPPHSEMKLVTCIEGKIFDVAVDIRKNSKTFLHYFATELSAENQKSMLIPEGFAHGFQCLSERCSMIYFHSAAFTATAAGGIHPQDPKLAIIWPQQVARLSAQDAGYPMLQDDFSGVVI
jgi:dTDP-4-dehydrorhamnose 3,5-epimerase